MSPKAFYITTPIYYVNDQPHIGHAYTTVAADVIARFKRLDGYRVKFLTGTDEHGQKVEKAADKAGVNPQQFVDQVAPAFSNLARCLQATNEDFIRTTEPRHYKAVQYLWEQLRARGEIYLGSYEGWYAVNDEAFYSEAELLEGKAPTGAAVEWVSEPSYFFRLSAWQEPLLRYYYEHPDFIAPESRRNEVIRFVEGGLTDLSISRTSFSWGVPVPEDKEHIIYVWLDALTNYLTALDYPQAFDEELWAACVHIVGKDILRFHAIYWPAFLLAAGLPLPRKIFAHGWWTIEGQKMSKTVGNTVDPLALIEQYSLDAVRYFFMRQVTFGQDGNFVPEELVSRINSDLANSYGNLVQRVLSFIQKNLQGILPQPQELRSSDQALISEVNALLPAVRSSIEAITPHRACEQIWKVIAEANRYIDEEKPWLLKTTNLPRLNTVLYTLSEVIRKLALLTQPLLPEGSQKILDQLRVPLDKRAFVNWDEALAPGTALPPSVGVFPRWTHVR